MQTITYTLDIGLANERKVFLGKSQAYRGGCFLNGYFIPGWTDLEDFATFCESIWFAMDCVYRRES